jgi:hypothetical protein
MTGPYDDEDLVIVEDTDGIPDEADPDEDLFREYPEPPPDDAMDDDW